jgi:hypothetical protein
MQLRLARKWPLQPKLLAAITPEQTLVGGILYQFGSVFKTTVISSRGRDRRPSVCRQCVRLPQNDIVSRKGGWVA